VTLITIASEYPHSLIMTFKERLATKASVLKKVTLPSTPATCVPPIDWRQKTESPG